VLKKQPARKVGQAAYMKELSYSSNIKKVFRQKIIANKLFHKITLEE
jgi:hypothetical protein